MPPGPFPVLVVSSWYPSVTDPVSGRFVADQVSTLEARGNVTLGVVSFDPADLIGSGPVRARIAAVIGGHVGAAIHAPGALFRAGSSGGSLAPIARLGISSGRYREVGSTHALAARLPAMDALADRWLSGTEAVVARPALVHAHTVYPDGAAAARLAARLGCPLILTEHASTVERLVSAPEVRTAYVRAVEQAAHLVVVSRSLAAELVRIVPDVAPKILVIPNGVAMSEFTLTPRSERRPGELLFVGYRKATKGIGTLLRAVAELRTSRPEISLRLIGGAPTEALEAGWRRQAIDLGIADIVSFEGPTDRTGVAAAMARASLFVHPSPRETFGVVAVEALASGLPVVAADSGGVTEILGDDPDALGGLVPADRPDLLAGAVGAALDRLDSLDPAALRASVEARFAWPIVAARLEALYAETSEPSAPTPVRVPVRVPAPDAGATAGRPPLIVVALDPVRAAQVGRVVAETGGAVPGISLVTSSQTVVEEDAFKRVVRTSSEIRISGLADAAVLRSGSGGLGRWLQLGRHPVALARRRGWLGGLEDAAASAGDAAIRTAIRRAAKDAAESGAHEFGAEGDGSAPSSVVLVCADGIDHLAAARVVVEGLATTAPGGVRWLGDVLTATMDNAETGL